MSEYRTDEYMFNHLSRPVTTALRRAGDPSVFATNEAMVAIVFTGFMLEAYCNHLGHPLAGDSWDKGKLRKIRQKMAYLCARVGIDIGPFKDDLLLLVNLRDYFAHGRTSSHYISEGEYRRQHGPHWYEQCRVEVARRLYENTRAFMKALHVASGRDELEFDALRQSGNIHTTPPHLPPASLRRD